jgi:hypothetical protein
MTFQQLHRQTEQVPSTVEVALKDDPDHYRYGVLLRHDASSPDRMVVILENGWTVLGDEIADMRIIGTTDLPVLLPRGVNALFNFLKERRRLQADPLALM